jgi:hypothetical protein
MATKLQAFKLATDMNGRLDAECGGCGLNDASWVQPILPGQQ